MLLQRKTISQQKADRARFDNEAALARVQELESQLQLIQRDLENSKVLSPINGLVSVRHVEAGQTTTPYQPLFSLEAVQSVKASVYVGEKVVTRLQVGNQARVETVAGTFDSAVYSIGAKADPETGNYEVRVLLSNADNSLKPGMSADVHLSPLPRSGCLVIPESALASYRGNYVVYRVEQGIARRTPVELTMESTDQLQVTRGLVAGEAIITKGAQLVRDGSPVEVYNE